MAWLKDHITEERIAKVQQLEEVADVLGITTAQLVIAWFLRRKEISTVISSATRLSQLEENIAAGEAVDKLTNEVLERREEILDNDPAAE